MLDRRRKTTSAEGGRVDRDPLVAQQGDLGKSRASLLYIGNNHQNVYAQEGREVTGAIGEWAKGVNYDMEAERWQQLGGPCLTSALEASLPITGKAFPVSCSQPL